jgi:hypothetical protein
MVIREPTTMSADVMQCAMPNSGYSRTRLIDDAVEVAAGDELRPQSTWLAQSGLSV